MPRHGIRTLQKQSSSKTRSYNKGTVFCSWGAAPGRSGTAVKNSGTEAGAGHGQKALGRVSAAKPGRYEKSRMGNGCHKHAQEQAGVRCLPSTTLQQGHMRQTDRAQVRTTFARRGRRNLSRFGQSDSLELPVPTTGIL